MNRLGRVLAAFALLAGAAAAQDARGTIMGFVKDGQGAVVVNATVLVTNTDTNATVRVSTNESGYYEAALLLPGPYTVSAELAGFKKTLRSGIVLQVSDRRAVDFALEVGAVSDSVTVTAEAPLVDVSQTSRDACWIRAVSRISRPWRTRCSR
jgi:hypothetical protein